MVDFDRTEEPLPVFDKDVILMQSTGLVDDSGIEVFEGDIVNDGCCDGTYPIKWDEETASFVFYVNDPGEEVRYIQPGNSMEVVGNIYENPELLDQKKGI